MTDYAKMVHTDRASRGKVEQAYENTVYDQWEARSDEAVNDEFGHLAQFGDNVREVLQNRL